MKFWHFFLTHFGFCAGFQYLNSDLDRVKVVLVLVSYIIENVSIHHDITQKVHQKLNQNPSVVKSYKKYTIKFNGKNELRNYKTRLVMVLILCKKEICFLQFETFRITKILLIFLIKSVIKFFSCLSIKRKKFYPNIF